MFFVLLAAAEGQTLCRSLRNWLIEKLTATFISFMPPLAFLAIVIALQPINHIYFYVFAIVIAFFLDKYCV